MDYEYKYLSVKEYLGYHRKIKNMWVDNNRLKYIKDTKEKGLRESKKEIVYVFRYIIKIPEITDIYIVKVKSKYIIEMRVQLGQELAVKENKYATMLQGNKTEQKVKILYDIYKNKIVSDKKGRKVIVPQIKHMLTDDLTKKDHRYIDDFLKDYFEATIKKAIEEQELSLYITGWSSPRKDAIYIFPGMENSAYDDYEEALIIKYMEFKDKLKSKEIFMMNLYTLAAVTKKKYSPDEKKLYTVLNLYGNNTKKRNWYANLYFNFKECMDKPHQLSNRTSISLSSDYEKNNDLLWYNDIPVIIHRKGGIKINDSQLRKIENQLGERYMFSPVVLSSAKLVQDDILNICTDVLPEVEKRFRQSYKLNMSMFNIYIQWQQEIESNFNSDDRNHTFKRKILGKDKSKTIQEVVKKNAENFMTEKADEQFEYFITVFEYYMECVGIDGEDREYYREIGIDYLKQIICNETTDHVSHDNKDYIKKFKKIFLKEIYTEDNIKSGKIILCKDSVDKIDCYFLDGDWWIEEFKKHNVPYNYNSIKKMLYDAGILDHFKTGPNNTRSTYTVQRKIGDRDKQSYFRIKKSAIEAGSKNKPDMHDNGSSN